MPTIWITGAFKVRIYAADHNPPHVHIVAGSDQAKIAIDDGSVIVGRLRAAVRKEAVAWVRANREFLLDEWQKLQGRDR